MKKVLLHLLAAFRNLGCKVVHASFQRIILNTGKSTPTEAYAHISRLISNLRKRNIFRLLGIQLQSMWWTLFWLDDTNYGGIRLSDDGLWSCAIFFDMASLFPPHTSLKCFATRSVALVLEFLCVCAHVFVHVCTFICMHVCVCMHACM